jgi:GxxExxY protein
MMMGGLIFPEESYRIIGACFEVHKRQGSGFLEAVYQECLGVEFRHQGIPFLAMPELQLTYRDQVLKLTFRPDFVCFGKIIVEIKAVEKLVDEHRAQVLNYLNASGYELGLLINFGTHPKLEHERFVLTRRNEVARE